MFPATYIAERANRSQSDKPKTTELSWSYPLDFFTHPNKTLQTFPFPNKDNLRKQLVGGMQNWGGDKKENTKSVNP